MNQTTTLFGNGDGQTRFDLRNLELENSLALAAQFQERPDLSANGEAWSRWVANVNSLLANEVSKKHSQGTEIHDESELRRLGALRQVITFENEDFRELELNGRSFPCATKFIDCDFHAVSFEKAKFCSLVEFRGCRFFGCYMADVGIDIHTTLDFRNCEFIGEFRFHLAYLERTAKDRSQFALFERCKFDDSRIYASSFDNCTLTDTSFEGSTHEGTHFWKADLTGSSFRKCNFSGGVVFADATMRDVKMDHRSILSMKDEGGLSTSQKMDMQIFDDFVTLRGLYGGFNRWIHGIALLIYIFPYAWFIAYLWSKASFLDNPSEDHISIGLSFAHFVFNGGRNWWMGFDFHPSFLLFLAGLAYNLIRVFVLTKTMRLEQQERATGYPPIQLG